MKSVTHSIFKTFLLSVLVVAQMHFAYAQTASILPPAKTTFIDANGKPLTAGTVESFIPATTTHKTTWQDAAETIPNANPLTLDAAGRALLLGSGSYRQVVKDRLNNVIWDQVTSSTGSGGGGGSTATGDGDLVGTIKPWAGMTAPNQYVFTYGQELSRTTYSALFTAITSTQSVFCNSGSPILSGLGDTTNFWIGMTIEISCVAPGFTTVISKTATTVTMAVNANVTINTNGIFFPWGRGNGSTTFNMPDFRGFAIAGNDIMGGVAANRLTTTYFGATDPNSSGAAGGAENTSITLTNGNLPSGYAPAGTIGGTGSFDSLGVAGTAGASFTALTTSGGTPRAVTLTGATFTGIPAAFGGVANAAVVSAPGSGYTNGAQTITIAGGTCATQPQFTVTVVGNAFTNPPVLLTAGSCTSPPNNPAATTGGGGTGGQLTVTYTTTPILKSIVPPTKTSNYIIKVLPDDNSATASGVTALGGMTGSVACGAGLLCTGNTISATVLSSALTVGSTVVTAGTTTRVLFDNAGILGEYNISGTANVAMTTSPVFITPTLGVATATSINGFSFTRGTASTASFGIGDTTTSPVMNGAADNISIGSGAGLGLTTGTQNVLIGSGNGGALTVDTGNTLIGYLVGQNLHNGVITQNYNSALGNQALRQCTTCGSNVAMGRASMLAETVGDHNTAVGHAALFVGVANVQVTAIGDTAGGAALAGSAIPAGFPNVGANVFGISGDSNLECIGELCGKRNATALQRAWGIGSYARLLTQPDSFQLGNGSTVGATSAKLWTGATTVNVSSGVGVTLTAAQLLTGHIDRTGAPGAGFSDTTPTAQQIVQSTSGGPGNACDVPMSRTISYGNRNTGQIATLVAGAGVTLASTTNVLTVANNTGSMWMLVITNCTLGAEAVTMFRVQ